MAWTEGDNSVYYKRLCNIARQHLNSAEEGARLISLANSEDLGTNLDDDTSSMATKIEAVAFKGVIDDFAEFFAGNAVAADNDRREKIDAFLVEL